MNKYLLPGIGLLAIAAIGVYVSLPEDKKAELVATATTVKSKYDQAVEVLCSDHLNIARDELIKRIRVEYPDREIKDLCGKTTS